MSLLWKPLLAATIPAGHDLFLLPYPLYASPKIDGVRAMVQNSVVVSRKGLPIRNKAVQDIFGRAEYEGLDGELVIGKPYGDDTFNRTTDKGLGVNNGSEEAALHFQRKGCFWVFDKYGPQTDRASGGLAYYSFELRQKDLVEDGVLVGDVNCYVRLLRHQLVRNVQELERYEATQLARGYEGVMLRSADSGAYPQKVGKDNRPTKDNRSTLNEFHLAKLKRFEFEFATIYDWHPLEHNTNEAKTAAGKRSTSKAGIVVDENQIGSLTLNSKKWGKFTISVPTNLLREKGPIWWSKRRGKTVRFKYQVAGTKDKPRIPTATFAELL